MDVRAAAPARRRNFLKELTIPVVRRVPAPRSCWRSMACRQLGSVPARARRTDRRVGEPARLHNGGWGPAPSSARSPPTARHGYEVRAYATRKTALRDAAAALPSTQTPVVMMAWRGAHTWVMHRLPRGRRPDGVSGRRVTGAPHLRPVVSPGRRSSGDPRTRPALPGPRRTCKRNFLPWQRPEGTYPDRDGKFLVVVPTIPSRRPAGDRGPLDPEVGRSGSAIARANRMRDLDGLPAAKASGRATRPSARQQQLTTPTVASESGHRCEPPAGACCASRRWPAPAAGQRSRAGSRGSNAASKAVVRSHVLGVERARHRAGTGSRNRATTATPRPATAVRPPMVAQVVQDEPHEARPVPGRGAAVTAPGTPPPRTRRRSGSPARSGSCARSSSELTLPATSAEATEVKNRKVSGSMGWLMVFGSAQAHELPELRRPDRQAEAEAEADAPGPITRMARCSSAPTTVPTAAP